MPEQNQNSETVNLTAADVGTVDLTPKSHPMRKMGNKDVFCAKCQAVRSMHVGLDKNNEILTVCPDCNHFYKFPLVEDPAELDKMLLDHHESNKGQITVEMAEAAQKEYDDKFKKLMGIA